MAFPDTTFLTIDGFDEAILGVHHTIEDTKKLIYSVKAIIEILCRDEMSEEDAWEYFNYNIDGSFMGDATPMFCYDLV